MKKICVVVLCLMMIFAVTGCSNSGQPSASGGGTSKIKVIATVYPVYEFAKQVGGDKIEVDMLVPAGAEPHDWEPKAKDMGRIKSANLFLYHGAGLEPWTAKMLQQGMLGNVTALEAAKGIPLLAATEENTENHDQHNYDPHVWLDPVLAQQEVQNIADALAQIDPANRDYYYSNAQRYQAELIKLDADYRETLKTAVRHDIVTSHSAFGYLAKRYGLYQEPIMGLSPDAEPTPEKMSQVVKFCQSHAVKYIFFETLVSPKLAQTIAQEAGAQVLVLNPIEGVDDESLQQGKNYISLMKENLVNLKKALSE